MSLLHRNLLSAAFKDMLQKFEPIVADTLETAVAIVAPKAATAVTAAVEVAEALTGATTSSNVDAVVAAQTAPPAAAPPAAPVAAPATPAAPVVNLSADKQSAAAAAVQALELQMANLATQLAAIKSNLT